MNFPYTYIPVGWMCRLKKKPFRFETVLRHQRNQICVQNSTNNTQVSEKTPTMSSPASSEYQVNRRASARVSCDPWIAWRAALSSRRTRLSCQRIPSTSMLQMVRPSSSSYFFCFRAMSQFPSTCKGGRIPCAPVQQLWSAAHTWSTSPCVPGSACGTCSRRVDWPGRGYSPQG